MIGLYPEKPLMISLPLLGKIYWATNDHQGIRLEGKAMEITM
jgi:hypothetical protein